MSRTITHAIILAAGVGKRLDVFETPKPLIRVAGRCLLDWQVSYLQEAGIKEILVLVSAEDKMVRRFVEDQGWDGVRCVSHEKNETSLLDSFEKALSFYSAEQNVLLTMSDLIFESNPYPDLLSKYEGLVCEVGDVVSGNVSYSGAQICVSVEGDVVVSVSSVEDARVCQDLEVGIFLMTDIGRKQILGLIPEVDSFSSLMRLYCSQHTLQAIRLPCERWFDVNVPATRIRAELMMRPDENGVVNPRDFSYKSLVNPVSYGYSKELRFDVHVHRGLLDDAGAYEIIPHERYYCPHYLIVDRNIDVLYGDPLYQKLKQLGYTIHKILVDSGEHSKSLASYSAVCDEICQKGIDKKSILISVGGGVIKDLVGFAASTLYRGIGFIAIPSTVLSQCDAAIALKQGINGDKGKNLIGSYYAPMKVLVDPEMLRTLDERYIRDGLAEIIKQAFAQDVGLYRFFDEYNGDVTDIDFLHEAIERSIALKIPAIMQDFNEEHIALVYQYGHEIGHAIEYLSGYRLGHGESVAIGMRVSAELSRLMGVASDEVVEAQIRMLKKYKLPCSIPLDILVDDVISMLRYHKKFHSGDARFVLVDSIGSLWKQNYVWTATCGFDVVREALNKSYDR